MTPSRFREIINALGHKPKNFGPAIQWPVGLIRGIARDRFPCPTDLADWMEAKHADGDFDGPPPAPPQNRDWRIAEPEKVDG